MSDLTKSYNGQPRIGGRSRSVSPETPLHLQPKPLKSSASAQGTPNAQHGSLEIARDKSTASKISAVLQSLTAEQTAELQAALAVRASA